MKRLILVATTLTLAGCQTAAFGYKTDEILAAQRPASEPEVEGVINAMREHLYDPYSVRDAEISNVVTLNSVPVLCVKANAKNPMGGYIGRQTVMVYLHQNRPYMVSQAAYAVAGCNQLSYRRFVEVERLQAL